MRLPEERLRFADEERKRLAIRSAEFGRALLTEVATLVTPDTILRRHRVLVAAKWTFKAKAKSARVGLMAKIRGCEREIRQVHRTVQNAQDLNRPRRRVVNDEVRVDHANLHRIVEILMSMSGPR